jgi:hypothetical protein
MAIDLILGQFRVDKIPYIRNCFYHHGIVANWKGMLTWGDYRKPFFSDSLGLVDRTNRIVKLSDKKYRILFIGDSFTEGVAMAYDETFVGLIAKKLDQSKFEVLNASVISYSPKLYYLKVKYLLEKVGLKFNELVVCPDISDIQDEIVYQSFQPSDSIYCRLFSHLLFFLRNNSATFHEINEIQNNINSRSTGYWQNHLYMGWQGLAQRRDFNEERPEWTYDDKIWRKWGEEGFRLATQSMDKLLELCQKNGVKVTIAVYPWPSEFIHKNFESRNVFLWKRYCQEKGVGFINLYDAFDWSDKPKNIIAQYYIPKDVHFNANGQKLVASFLFKNLVEQDKLLQH